MVDRPEPKRDPDPGPDPSRPSDALGVAWDSFYDHCASIIRGCPSVRRLNDFDREDCVQEVMVEIVRKFGGAGPGSHRDWLPGWIRTVSNSKAIDIVRRRFRKPEVGFDDGAGAAVLDDAPDLGRGEYVGLVWEALVSLDQEVPVTSYLVFYMHKIEGWEIGEVADLFGFTPGQARVRCHRVKKKFDTLVRKIDPGGARPG